MSEVVVIAGMSGAGRSVAADNLEDLGWFVMDNLPPQLIPKVAELADGSGSGGDRLALVVGSAARGASSVGRHRREDGAFARQARPRAGDRAPGHRQVTQPAVVAIGGGHGLSMVLQALVDRCSSLTGVVSVADDGGSSGRLRRDLAIVAPGDMRRCLAALTPDGLVGDALEHRFDAGVLAGHPAGNVLLAAMLELEPDPVVVMDTLARMVGARGRVLPATAEPVDLIAATDRGTVKGQVAVSESGAIASIRHSPADPTVPGAVLDAIAAADAVIVGPGSLYTSVLAPVVPGVAAALASTEATVIYVANLADEPEETDGYDLADHIEAVVRHGIDPDVVVSDISAVVPDAWVGKVETFELTGDDPDVHDPRRLGAALASIISAS